MNPDYQIVIDRFKNGDFTLEGPIFDYRDDDLHDIYDIFFTAMNGHLQKRAAKLGWPDPVLVFLDEDGINAYADSGQHTKIIAINRGLVESLHEMMVSQEKVLAEGEFAMVGESLAATGNPASIALLQFVLAFCYQHEYTHLLQYTPGMPFTYQERLAVPARPADVPELHAVEMDADFIGLHRMAWLLTGHFKDDAGNWKGGSSEDITNLAAAAMASAFCMFVDFAQAYPAIYYGEYDHPHPLIRIAFIAQYLPEVVAADIPNAVLLDGQAALTKALGMAEKILQPKYGDAVKGLADMLIANTNQIQAYGNQMIALALNYPQLSHHRPKEHL